MVALGALKMKILGAKYYAVKYREYDTVPRVCFSESRSSVLGGILHIVWAVNANWNAGNGWNVNANEVTNPNPWDAGNLVFSRNYCFSPRLTQGSFCYQTFLPAAKLTADLLKTSD